jgi:hypothetical protein
MNRTRVLAAGAVGALLVAAATSFASPWWTLHDLQSAAARRDADAVAALVDFPALRASVKSQVQRSLDRNLGMAGSDNPLAKFGQALASTLVDPLVDAVVSPAGVAAMVEHGKITVAKPQAEPGAADAPPAPASTPAEPPRYAVHYRGLNGFAVTARDGGSFLFHRTGLWSWQLAGIELPAEG